MACLATLFKPLQLMIIPLRLCLRFLIEGILRIFGSFCFLGVDVWGVSLWCEFSIGLSSMSNKAEYEFDVVIDLVLKIDESKLAKPQPNQIQEKLVMFWYTL